MRVQLEFDHLARLERYIQAQGPSNFSAGACAEYTIARESTSPIGIFRSSSPAPFAELRTFHYISIRHGEHACVAVRWVRANRLARAYRAEAATVRMGHALPSCAHSDAAVGRRCA